MDIERELHDLIAHRDIQAAINDYMRGQDRLLPEVQLRAFHTDAHVDCGIFAGGPEEYVKFAQGFLAALESSHHLIGQTSITVDGDNAEGEVYFLAQHRVNEDGAEKDLFVAGRYLDHYQRRNGVWKISRRKEVIDWARMDPASDSNFFSQNSALHLGSRG